MIKEAVETELKNETERHWSFNQIKLTQSSPKFLSYKKLRNLVNRQLKIKHYYPQEFIEEI